jgi:hypothetical protein
MTEAPLQLLSIAAGVVAFLMSSALAGTAGTLGEKVRKRIRTLFRATTDKPAPDEKDPVHEEFTHLQRLINEGKYKEAEALFRKLHTR